MLRKSLLFIGTLGLVIASPLAAKADICFRYQTGGGTLVAKGANLPARNTCENLAMFEVGGLAGAATGSLCKGWNDNSVVYHYAYHSCLGPGSYFESGTCYGHLSTGQLPLTNSSCRITANGSPFLDTTLSIFSGPDCVKLNVPDANGPECTQEAPWFSHPKLAPNK